MSKPKRKAGEGDGQPPSEPATDGKAGGQRATTVRFWDIPEEFEAVDYTKQEDIKDLIRQPDQSWGVPDAHQGRPHYGGENEAPAEAVSLVQRARELQTGPVLSALINASDDLYSWAATRVAKDPAISLEDLLEEMQLFGAADLAAEAASLMEKTPMRMKAGEQVRLIVKDTLWAPGEPGQGGFELDGISWRTWDYMEDIVMDEELAATLGLVEPVDEKRQCVTRLWRQVFILGGTRLVQTPKPVSFVMPGVAPMRLERARVSDEAPSMNSTTSSLLKNFQEAGQHTASQSTNYTPSSERRFARKIFQA